MSNFFKFFNLLAVIIWAMLLHADLAEGDVAGWVVIDTIVILVNSYLLLTSDDSK